LKRKRTFKKYSYRGVELDKLLDLKNEEFIDVCHRDNRNQNTIRSSMLIVLILPACSRTSQEEVSEGSQEEAFGFDQEAQEGQEGGSA
jgi:hypothetical protein